MRRSLFPGIGDFLFAGIAQVSQLLSQFNDHPFQLHDLPCVVHDDFVQLLAKSLLVRQLDLQFHVLWVGWLSRIFDRFIFRHYTSPSGSIVSSPAVALAKALGRYNIQVVELAKAPSSTQVVELAKAPKQYRIFSKIHYGTK